MNSIKFNDWQEMALKKDTETIIKKLDSHQPIFFSICWEIVFAVGSIMVDHLFDTTKVSNRIWLLCAIVAVLPPVVVLVTKVVQWIFSIYKAKAGIYNIKGYVDVFDNQLCYWVMMCTSYCNLLSGTRPDQKTEKIFLYQEGFYYINKSIQSLYEMKPIIDKVFSNNHNVVTKNGLIATHRLFNFLDLMKQCSVKLASGVDSIKSEQLIQEQIAINDVFKQRLVLFIKDVNKLYDTSFTWD